MVPVAWSNTSLNVAMKALFKHDYDFNLESLGKLPPIMWVDLIQSSKDIKMKD